MLGISSEKDLVISLNKKENLGLWEILGLSHKNHVAIHVNTKKKSNYHDQKILPKADVFIAYGVVEPDILSAKQYLLTEDDLEALDLHPIDNTGISVKKENSKSYTITKISPEPFKKVFGNFELGCGVSLFVNKEEEIKLNESLILNGWKTNMDEFISFFKDSIPDVCKLKEDISISEKKSIYSKIKKESVNRLETLIENDIKIKEFVFNGIGAFEEPYTARYLYQDGILSDNCYIPYTITTGSGRNKGKFTVVIKPK